MSEIDLLRSDIDELTLEMVRLLKKRTDIAKKIGEIKKAIGKEITDEQREMNLRNKVVNLCKNIDFDEAVGVKFLNFLLNESIKVQSTEKQTHLSVFLKAKNLEEAGKRIVHMEVGEPDFMPPHIVKTALHDSFDKGFIRYGPAGGIPKFRKALAEHVCNKFKGDAKAENILVSPGGRFSVFLAISTLLNPGDEMIIIEPAWPAYRDCAINAGVKVRSVKTSLHEGWEPSESQIAEAIGPNTKMIVLNYPNNPTGKIISPRNQDKIVQLAKDNDLFVLSDEIYSDYAYSEWKSVLQYQYSKGIVTQSFSKSHAMTGFRIGYAIASSDIINKMIKLQALALTNVSEPVQYAAMQALQADTSENSRVIKARLETLSKMAQDVGLEFVRPDGAMYLFARPKDRIDSVQFSEELLNYGVAVAPGTGFGDYREFIRISACREEKTLIEGMNILNKALGEKRWQKR